jgi:hypothetical protein
MAGLKLRRRAAFAAVLVAVLSSAAWGGAGAQTAAPPQAPAETIAETTAETIAETTAETTAETIAETIVVPDFGGRGQVPQEVIGRFMRDFRRQLEQTTGFGVSPGELVSPGLAGSLDAGLFAALLSDLGEGRYGVTGEISGPTVQRDGREGYSVNLLIVDARTGHASDLLSRVFPAGRTAETARLLADEVRRFVEPGVGLPAGSAELYVSSQPGEADVYVNGTYIGRTGPALEVLSLTPGRYELEWRKEGFLPSFDVVTAKDDRIDFAHALLQPTSTGGVHVTSRPAARVYVDNRLIGTTPLTEQVSPGQHSLRLERPGFESETTQVTVQRSRVSRVERQLRPVSSPLLFWEAPEGYLVYVNGLPRARPFVADLPPGSYLVELVAPGETRRFEIYLPSVGSFEIDFTAQRLVPLYRN